MRMIKLKPPSVSSMWGKALIKQYKQQLRNLKNEKIKLKNHSIINIYAEVQIDEWTDGPADVFANVSHTDKKNLITFLL